MGLTRSQQMSRIRGKDTTPERVLRAQLRLAGLRFRLNYRIRRARPDVAFPKARVAVFVDGCFWHGCPKHYVRPRSGGEFWPMKLVENVERDRRQTKLLEGEGWRTVRLWEHEVFERVEIAASRVVRALNAVRWRPAERWQAVSVSEMPGTNDIEAWHLVELRDRQVPRDVMKKRSTKKWRRGK